MAMIGATANAPRKNSILPEGGRDFLRRRLMELVGSGVTIAGVFLLLALFTFSPGDPSLNHATASAPKNLVGWPGAYIADLLMQTFGLAIFLVPVAMITWGVRLVRTHHLGFFGLRLSLLLLALLMMSVACVGMGNVGDAATHAGAGGLVGLALAGRFREVVLSHSSGGALVLIEPICAALALIAMAPALGMNRTDLPLIFRILRAPFLWGGMLMRAAIGLWRGRPLAYEESGEPPSPSIGYADIPGEIDASTYNPPDRFEQIPEEGVPLPPRGSLLADAPYSPFERPPEIPAAPPRIEPYAANPHGQRASAPVQDHRPIDRQSGVRVEPTMARPRPAAPSADGRIEPAFAPVGERLPPAAPRQASEEIEPEFDGEGADENPFAPDEVLADEPATPPVAAGPKIIPRKPGAPSQGKRAAKAGQRELDLVTGEISFAAARHPARSRHGSRPRPRSTRKRWSRTPACWRRCSTISASRARS